MGLLDEAGRRIQGLLDKTDLDEKAAAAVQAVKQKGQELLDRTQLDEKAAAAASALQQRMDRLLHGQETAGPAPEPRSYGVQADVPTLAFELEAVAAEDAAKAREAEAAKKAEEAEAPEEAEKPEEP